MQQYSQAKLCTKAFLPKTTKLGQGYIFRSVCQEFCSRGVSRPTPRDEVMGSGWGAQGIGWGVWPGGPPGQHPRGSPGPQLGGVQAQALGVSQHALRQTPLSSQLLLLAVHILLECILVCNVIHKLSVVGHIKQSVFFYCTETGDNFTINLLVRTISLQFTMYINE